jgi:hypothetical protein
MSNAGSDEQIRSERIVLAALCQGVTAGPHKLRAQDFREPEHQVLFDALSRLNAQRVTITRESLLAILTRMGFPEMDVEWLFAPRADAQ